MTRKWMSQAERGSPFLIDLIVRITLGLGRPMGRLLLYPITLYFVLFSSSARHASNSYLSRVLDQPVKLRHIFRHYHTFAATILDRVYLLSGRQDYFDIEMQGQKTLFDQLDEGRGCLLLGSHLGSFEVLRSLAEKRPDIRVRPMMYMPKAGKINQVLTALNPKITDQVIPIGEPESLFQVREALGNGEVVGILGDRIAIDGKSTSCNFFGLPCRFPTGPLLIAGLMEIPVVLFFGLYCGGRSYKIIFELLTPGFRLDHAHREEEIREWTQRYVDRLEHYSRQAPYNWFNFYDFWDENDITSG